MSITDSPAEWRGRVCRAALEAMASGHFDADSSACVVTLAKIVDNVVHRPDDARTRQIRCANATFHQKVTESTRFGFGFGFVSVRFRSRFGRVQFFIPLQKRLITLADVWLDVEKQFSRFYASSLTCRLN